MVVQIVLAPILAAAVSQLAIRAHALTRAGGLAATAVGTLIFTAGGPAWSCLLLLFFVSGSVLSRVAPARTHDEVTGNGKRRDASQVFANGGPAAVAALLWMTSARPTFAVAFAGSLAAATADTWATELGRLSAWPPRRLLLGRPVPPGRSGGMTPIGTAASLLGALVIAASALPLLGLGRSELVVVASAGLAGALFDSILGARLQRLNRCPVCNRTSEAPTHPACGTPTVYLSGLSWLDNDAVNLAATSLGAIIALAWALALPAG